ncbi:FAD-binding oxidoreductase [Pleurocapsales cyanobacterium LEGE 06147]|nr:FAD-binding oxidoreductase [Pleurocapsales cyanobacterium LEGE 06147]
MKTVYDAIVVGGGIVGMSIAYHLVRQGAKTLLFDRTDITTDAGAGIISPYTSRFRSEVEFNFALKASG